MLPGERLALAAAASGDPGQTRSEEGHGHGFGHAFKGHRLDALVGAHGVQRGAGAGHVAPLHLADAVGVAGKGSTGGGQATDQGRAEGVAHVVHADHGAVHVNGSQVANSVDDGVVHRGFTCRGEGAYRREGGTGRGQAAQRTAGFLAPQVVTGKGDTQAESVVVNRDAATADRGSVPATREVVVVPATSAGNNIYTIAAAAHVEAVSGAAVYGDVETNRSADICVAPALNADVACTRSGE